MIISVLLFKRGAVTLRVHLDIIACGVIVKGILTISVDARYSSIRELINLSGLRISIIGVAANSLLIVTLKRVAGSLLIVPPALIVVVVALLNSSVSVLKSLEIPLLLLQRRSRIGTTCREHMIVDEGLKGYLIPCALNKLLILLL